MLSRGLSLRIVNNIAQRTLVLPSVVEAGRGRGRLINTTRSGSRVVLARTSLRDCPNSTGIIFRLRRLP
jgi:hypothetical protein